MECEIKLAWIQGYIQSEFDRNIAQDWTKAEKLARKSWRKNCENLTWANRPAQDVVSNFNLELAA